MSNQFLSILAGFIIQIEQIIFRDKLGHQEMVITIKGWQSNRVSVVKQYAIFKTGQ